MFKSFNQNISILALAILTFILKETEGLECYVCTNQENNNDKCVKTIKTCDVLDDRCLSEVRWGSTPYWAPSGEKQFYITKRCANRFMCENVIRNYSRRCDRIWYNDWECAECCHGDRCNYYVTLGSSSLSSSPLIHLLLLIGTRWLLAQL